jgi:hypothetical protein
LSFAESGPARFRLYCSAVGLTAGIASVLLASHGPAPAIVPIVVFGSLFAIAENTSVALPNRSSVSASLMLAVASIVVFRDHAFLLGPLLVGMFGGLYWPQLRHRDITKIAFNVGNFGLSTLAAAAVYSVVSTGVRDSVALALLAAVPAALVFSTVNSVLLVPAVSMLTGRSLSAVGREMWMSDLQILPFGVLGVLLGRLYLGLGAWIVPLFVAPIFIARQAFASYMQVRTAHEATLATLVRALEAKDRYTAGHVERVANFAHLIGLELGMRPRQLERLRHAALMHDIGKLIVPNHILNKPDRLTSEEFQRMRQHESVSVELLRRIDFLRPAAPSIEAEIAAGSKSGAMPDLPIETRIIAVADAFDAMTSTRAYRRALAQEVAFRELREKSGSQFDAACVGALIGVIERRGDHYGAGHETDIADFAVPPPTRGTGSAGLGDLARGEERVTT